MKNIVLYFLCLPALLLALGCEKSNYPGGEISPYIGIYDLRNIHKGEDVVLTKDNMKGSSKIAAMVVSDHTGKNLPENFLIVQDMRRLGQIRGITIQIPEAKNYVPGDSVIINVEGKKLQRVAGLMEVTGVTNADITKVSSGNNYYASIVNVGQILNDPTRFESTFTVIVKGGFNPLPKPTDVVSGDKVLNDGFGDIMLRTLPTATFANEIAMVNGNYYGVVLLTEGAEGALVPHYRVMRKEGMVLLSSVIEITPIVIAGLATDVKGGDVNYEYVQLMATRDIDFSVTPFSMVTTTNPNAAVPTGFPNKGWAMGGARTYKMNITSGKAQKGKYFYVGGKFKLINGSGSTSIADANWVKNYDYGANTGEGFGNVSTGLFANTGNSTGVAIFEGTTVDVNSKPVDVMFVSGGGSLYTATPSPMGYKITNNDWYDVINPLTLKSQPYFRSGSNNLFLSYNTADVGFWYLLGGEYNVTLGKWVKARTQTNFEMTKTTTLAEIESEAATKLKE